MNYTAEELRQMEEDRARLAAKRREQLKVINEVLPHLSSSFFLSVLVSVEEGVSSDYVALWAANLRKLEESK